MKNISLQDTSSLRTKSIVFVVFALIFLWFKFTFHEGWKDEWQAWLMARDMSWGELTASLYYEGHPALWYYWLKIWTGIGGLFSLSDWTTLQVSHAFVVLAAYAVIIFRFRFSLWLKVLFLLGYFPFFEYGLINRGYAFVMLIGFLLSDVLSRKEVNKMAAAGLVFLLCQTEVYGVLIAGGLVLYHFAQHKNIKEIWQDTTSKWLTGGILLGLFIFILCVFPRGSEEELNSAYLDNPLSSEVITAAIQGNFTKTYIPGLINTVKSTEVTGVGFIGALFIMAGLFFFFFDNKQTRWSFTVFSLVFLLFCSLFYLGGVRQWGNHFLFFLMLLNLYAVDKKELSGNRLGVVIIIVIFQLQYAFLGIRKDYVHPFSNAAKTAEFIQKNIPESTPIVAINKFETAPVGGYAGRKFYELPTGEPFSYFKWVEKVYLPPQDELILFAQYKKVKNLVVISPKPLDKKRYPALKPLKNFRDYNIKNENYFCTL